MSMAAPVYKPQPYPTMGQNSNFLGSPVTSYSTTPPMSPISPQSTQSSITGYNYQTAEPSSSSSSYGGGGGEPSSNMNNNNNNIRGRSHTYDGCGGVINTDDGAFLRSPSYEDEMQVYHNANQRTLELFDEAVLHGHVTHTLDGDGGAGNSTTTPRLSTALSHSNPFSKRQKDRSEVDRHREQAAKVHALSLLERQLNQETADVSKTVERPLMQAHSTKHAPKLSGAALMTVPKSGAVTTTRSSQQSAATSKTPTFLQVPLGVHPLVLLRNKEDMATTTRPRKPKTADDVRDPETVSGMKCKLDWDREKDAKNRALALLRKGFMD